MLVRLCPYVHLSSWTVHRSASNLEAWFQKTRGLVLQIYPKIFFPLLVTLSLKYYCFYLSTAHGFDFLPRSCRSTCKVVETMEWFDQTQPLQNCPFDLSKFCVVWPTKSRRCAFSWYTPLFILVENYMEPRNLMGISVMLTQWFWMRQIICCSASLRSLSNPSLSGPEIWPNRTTARP